MTDSTLCLRSAAKINLTLEVGRRRPDGYHEIDSLVQTVGLWDQLTMTRTPGELSLECNWPALENPNNLVLRAAELLRARCGVKAGARLRLTKVIPAGAGLGGGSGNAAAALVGLARLWGLDLDESGRCELARQLGADVPLFLSGGLQRMQGVGERLTALGPGPSWHVVILKPELSLATDEAYRQLDLQSERVVPDSSAMQAALRDRDFPAAARLLANAFEAAALMEYSAVQEARDALLAAGAAGALLCGSGSAVFGLYAAREEAERAATKLKYRGLRWVAPFTASGWEIVA